MLSRRLFAGFGLLLASYPAFAWSGTGHMVIAAIAERDLSLNSRLQVARLLGVPVSLGAPYWQAATWADENRTDQSAPWHYINYHFRTDGKRTTNQPEKENVAVAIQRFRSILADRTKSDAARKEALLYVLHFVADAHQPLHAVARDTDRYPRGDRGGNEFAIESPSEFAWMARPPQNLHALWDMGAGLFVSEPSPLNEGALRRIRAQADTLRAAMPGREFAAIDDLNPYDWAKEGLDAAKSVVYRLEERTPPSEQYLESARTLCARRAAMAGYRLAEVLNKAFAK